MPTSVTFHAEIPFHINNYLQTTHTYTRELLEYLSR